MGNDVGERPVEDALTVKRTFELKERTVTFVGGLFGQRKCLFASHRVIPTRIFAESRDLLHGKVPLVAHGASACRTVVESREAVDANLKC